MADDDGISYYYRGSVKNNYVKFAGFYWRIIRINGDESVRLLYAGKKYNAEGNNLNTQFLSYNLMKDNPAYVGFKYGNTLNVSYDKSNSNEVDSNVKTELDKWYKTNILDTNNGAIIADAGFCNDRSISSGNGYSSTGSHTVYQGRVRFAETMSPTLKCPQENDLFTMPTNAQGNKALTYPVGLITVDELMLSGYADGYINKSTYTYSTSGYSTMTPSYYDYYSSAARILSLSNGFISTAAHTTNNLGLRPVINIRGDSKISGGIGTADDPFLINVS